MTTRIDIKEQGAIGDGVSLDSPFIQQAVDHCSETGGGTVVVPAGTYLIGTLFLKDNVTLHLEKGAVLQGSADLEHYENPDPYVDAVGQERGWALIAAMDCTNISITGEGTIDGNGATFKGKPQRPMLLRLVRSTGIQISGVSLFNSGAWVSHYFQCKNISVQDITIRSHGAGNNDGIDIDSCIDVNITGCTIDTGDDAICIKTTSAESCRNVNVTDCDLSSHWGTIKLGTESMGDMEHMRFSNCRIHKAGGGSIKVLSADGANIHDIAIEDITIDQSDLVVFMQLGKRMRTYRPDDPTLEPGSIRKITIRNIQATISDETKVNPSSGICLSGTPDQRIEDITLENISISLPGGGTEEDANRIPPLRETEYPEATFMGPFPAAGLYARHVRNLKLSNIELRSRFEDARPLQLFEDVTPS